MKHKNIKIIILVATIVILAVIAIVLVPYIHTQTEQAQQIEKQATEREIIHRLNEDFIVQSTSDEIGAIQADLTATDFSNIDLGLLE